MICGVAGAPYPGYSGSLAGPGGMALAQAVGLYDTLDSVALMPTNGEGDCCLEVCSKIALRMHVGHGPWL